MVQVCRSSPVEKGKFIKVVLALLQSTSTAVVYECAVTLVSLSQAPTAIRAAANCYTQQLVTQSDNNVKLIILDRLEVLFPPTLCLPACLPACREQQMVRLPCFNTFWHIIWERICQGVLLWRGDRVYPA
jgi:hypothetical protein